RRQWVPLMVVRLPPGSPVATAIRQAQESPFTIEQGLLYGFALPHALNLYGYPCAVQLGPAQCAVDPGQCGALPLDPGQALAVGAQAGAVVEITSFSQQLPLALQVDRHQTVDDLSLGMLFLHGDDPLALRIESQTAVAAP